MKLPRVLGAEIFHVRVADHPEIVHALLRIAHCPQDLWPRSVKSKVRPQRRAQEAGAIKHELIAVEQVDSETVRRFP